MLFLATSSSTSQLWGACVPDPPSYAMFCQHCPDSASPGPDIDGFIGGPQVQNLCRWPDRRLSWRPRLRVGRQHAQAWLPHRAKPTGPPARNGPGAQVWCTGAHHLSRLRMVDAIGLQILKEVAAHGLGLGRVHHANVDRSLLVGSYASLLYVGPWLVEPLAGSLTSPATGGGPLTAEVEDLKR